MAKSNVTENGSLRGVHDDEEEYEDMVWKGCGTIMLIKSRLSAGPIHSEMHSELSEMVSEGQLLNVPETKILMNSASHGTPQGSSAMDDETLADVDFFKQDCRK